MDHRKIMPSKIRQSVLNYWHL